jgi:hypothetical protein
VYTAVRNLDDGCDRMPEARAWDGPAHKAASAMFGRATDTASQFSHYTEGVAAALTKRGGTIGSARTALLNHADEVDHGELSVSDMWVVLIKPARVSAEKAAGLQAQAKAEQAEINRLLVALGDADSAPRHRYRLPQGISASHRPVRMIRAVWTRTRDSPNPPTRFPTR